MRTSGSDDRTVEVLYLDIRERRRDKNIPHTTQYPCRRETARMTCVEDVELHKAVGGVGSPASVRIGGAKGSEKGDSKVMKAGERGSRSEHL